MVLFAYKKFNIKGDFVMENKFKNTKSLAFISALVLFFFQLFSINNFADVVMMLGFGALAFSIYKNQKDKIALAGSGALVLSVVIRIFMNFSVWNIFWLLAELVLFAMILVEVVPTIDKEDVMGKIPENLRGYVVYLPAGLLAVSAVFPIIGALITVFRYGAFFFNFITILFMLIFTVIEICAYFFISMWAMNILVSDVEIPAADNETKEEKIVKPAGPMTDNEIYIDLAMHVILLLVTCGIWQLIWIYKVTKYLNNCPQEEYRNPTNKLLLCMFIPFYYIYWTYKSAQRVDKMSASRGIPCDIASLCLILSIFIGIVPPILIQMKLNALAEKSSQTGVQKPAETIAQPEAASAPQEPVANVDIAEEISKFKNLLDSGAITQEEYDAKKKQLLDI